MKCTNLIILLNKELYDFEDYIQYNECHTYDIVRGYDAKISKILKDLEAEQVNIVAYDIRFKKSLFKVNLEILESNE
jgi:hypothetical protein